MYAKITKFNADWRATTEGFTPEEQRELLKLAGFTVDQPMFLGGVYQVYRDNVAVTEAVFEDENTAWERLWKIHGELAVMYNIYRRIQYGAYLTER